ncbi:ABC transporter ATP-binding protein [Rhodobacter sp. Har01]|uniref:ABC transporter ATP-binding protein n=1 Tax=Rhodobacter sp. Har01 TaxID=2883999 RepID=UPI001D05EABB|nr:ABC transporter ATP-binding protein [Rhodobacter sp. Har01]MCB6179325.1 ABC transporter ATP-binding protein [Rhodobacter sp. Har01]
MQTKPVTDPSAAATRASILTLTNLVKTFGTYMAVDGIDLAVADGEFLTIVGPSGCGKTTLLRMLAGLELPTSGEIALRGQVINDLPPNRRPTCLVFQSLALFPHRSVGENIAFPMKMKGIAPEKRRARVEELMALMRLPAHYVDRNVMRCSGGERQRVALARAFAYDPEILFFDEPLSALDYKLRKELEKELKDIHKETGKTFIYITHSLEEAMVMSDRIAVMRSGRMLQVGTPEEIYTRPQSRFVAEFMGEVNVFPVRRAGDGMFDGTRIPGRFQVAGDPAAEGFIIVRPEAMRLVAPGETVENRIEARLYNSYSLGSRMQFRLNVGEDHLIVEQLRAGGPMPDLDREVSIGWDSRDAIFVEA